VNWIDMLPLSWQPYARGVAAVALTCSLVALGIKPMLGKPTANDSQLKTLIFGLLHVLDLFAFNTTTAREMFRQLQAGQAKRPNKLPPLPVLLLALSLAPLPACAGTGPQPQHVATTAIGVTLQAAEDALYIAEDTAIASWKAGKRSHDDFVVLRGRFMPAEYAFARLRLAAASYNKAIALSNSIDPLTVRALVLAWQDFAASARAAGVAVPDVPPEVVTALGGGQ
jgi:hypothetical protein